MPYTDKEKQKEAARRHYENNKEKMIKRASQHKKKHIKNVKHYIKEYLNSHPCVDCGETDPIVLEFDHTNPLEKTANIADMIRNGNSLEKIKDEIKKCEVRCCNCHRRRTYREKHWSSKRSNSTPTSRHLYGIVGSG